MIIVLTSKKDMKLQIYSQKIEMTTIPQTVIGIIFAIAFPIIAISILLGASNDWLTWIEVLALTIAYVIWLFTGFRNKVLRYAICFDDTGIHEKKVLGKGLEIAWKDLSEYVCEVTGSEHRTSEQYYHLIFCATDIETPVIIRTGKFPESQKSHFRNTVFHFCDKHQQK